MTARTVLATGGHSVYKNTGKTIHENDFDRCIFTSRLQSRSTTNTAVPLINKINFKTVKYDIVIGPQLFCRLLDWLSRSPHNGASPLNSFHASPHFLLLSIKNNNLVIGRGRRCQIIDIGLASDHDRALSMYPVPL